MKIRENTVVTLSYYFMLSPDEGAPSSPDKVHTMEVIIGRDMLPIDIELAIMNRDEGEEITIPVTVIDGTNIERPEICFFNFRELPEGIEFKKGTRVSVLRPDGSTEVIIVEDVLPEGILGRPLIETDEKPRWMKILIKSVRWATLREFQEGRVISKSRHYHDRYFL